MKNLLLTFVIALTVFISKATDSERFNKAMGETLVQLGQAKDVASFQEVANKFERIGNSETAEWLPNYYACLTYTLIAIQQKGDDIDKYLDKADTFVEKLAQQKVTSLDEVEVLKAQIAMMRISVDGQARFMKYGSAFEGAINKAKAINPENPRAYALKAQMIFYTPEQFGGGAKNACPEIQKALEKFANFKAISPISPNWGVEQIKGMAKACN
ncbi:MULTISPECIES: hypothetical protein [unclassified Arcicella]|uniref:hypothetical protein n=1 Tax=unclassified Arcicella TaxID=2644986 RepID=UPI0028637069|nr:MULTISPECIES: hypothetical protein [unclassified Arcicella]MDR6560124.1 hypothetical protein [Arcicella sp. BE51]MDR6810269.1 hypothetical protein [Arcicella sp. BE140]MDR6821619.1 hypothetical protein [Arcicella sp. BE139]